MPSINATPDSCLPEVFVIKTSGHNAACDMLQLPLAAVATGCVTHGNDRFRGQRAGGCEI